MIAPGSDALARWATVADGFTDRVDGVGTGGWDQPSPCAGWVARDLVVHLVEWVPPFLEAGAGVGFEPGPDPAEDPAGAWHHLEGWVRGLLRADPSADFDHPQAGRHPLGVAVDRFVAGDVLVHTWDLARATGQDERLDPQRVTEALAGMEPMVDALVASGHYGPPVEVDPDADEQDRLIALTGRTP